LNNDIAQKTQCKHTQVIRNVAPFHKYIVMKQMSAVQSYAEVI